MGTKQFKAESKRLLDLMINSIYTNKEIFLRELISNASDAIDKLYYKSLTDSNIKINKDNFAIWIKADKENRTLEISDNGCGMTEKELETNLGTIAKSGSLAFKKENEKKDDVDIIGQFGVGFYSCFMVSDMVTVISKAYGEDKAYKWTSKGVEGYEIEETNKDEVGTTIILHIKKDEEEENYSEFLESYTLHSIVKKYSDYIRYPIKMEEEHSKLKEGTKDEYELVKEEETLNSMIPIWKKSKSDITQEEYNSFYADKFFDYEKPARVIHTNIEGQYSYNALLYIPSHAPHDYYTKEYEKGLQLYSNGVLIMDKCAELLPDYFSFVKGLVDTQDLSLNISREMLQNDRGLRVIAKSLDKKILNELKTMLESNREEYEKFFNELGIQLKFGTYDQYGINKDKLKDLLLFYSSTEKKLVTLKEYVSRMKEGQDTIYYACGENVNQVDLLPQVDAVKDKGYEILYLTENVDEFVFKTLMNYEEKTFKNICTDELDMDSDEEKEKLKKENESNKAMFDLMKEAIKDQVKEIRFTHRLKNHPVCLISEGNITLEMQKVMNALPNSQDIQAEIVLEINASHPIANKIKDLYENDKDTLKEYTKILYAQARLIEGLGVDNPTELSNLICNMMIK